MNSSPFLQSYPRFLVIGAGNGGRAMAAYLVDKGYSVDLFNRSKKNLIEIKEQGGIWARGVLQGFFKLQRISDDLSALVQHADIILVVVPAFAHAEVARKLAPIIHPGQIIILNPGRTFGALEFRHIFDNAGVSQEVVVCETQTLLFTARMLAGNGVEVLRIKDSVKISSWPEHKLFSAYHRISLVFPQFRPVSNFLATTLNNIGCIFHPATTLLNSASIDRGQDLLFYQEGITPNTTEILKRVEREIIVVGQHLGVRITPVIEWVKKTYGINAETIYEAIQQVKAYRNISAPKGLKTRYLLEDVPTGLVPISSIGRTLGIETPTIDAIIHLTGILSGKNFWNIGRTVEKLGLTEYIRERARSISYAPAEPQDLGEFEELLDEEN